MNNSKLTIKDLENYLDENINKRLYKDDQIELAKMIYLTDGKHKLQKGFKIINAYFIDNDMPYTIKGNNFDKRPTLYNGAVNPNFKKGFWIMAKFTVN